MKKLKGRRDDSQVVFDADVRIADALLDVCSSRGR